MQRPCDQCGESYDADRPNSRFCGATCRKRHARNPTAAAAPVTVLPPTPGSVYAATLAELEAADRVATALGAGALALATRIDMAQDTGSALASAVKALGETLNAATKGAQVAATPLDQLRARRDAKRLA